MFCQETKDSLKDKTTKPIFYDKLSPDESWEIHKKNYIKKLKTKGITVDEIEKEITTYEKQKDNFLKNLKEQRKNAATNRNNAAKRRVEAEVRRNQATIQRHKDEKRRDEAKIRRKQAEEWRNSFENIITKEIIVSSQSSDIAPIIFKVKKKTSLIFRVNGKVNSGTTLIEFFNPIGEKEGQFLLEHKSNPELTKEDALLKSTSVSLNKLISDSEVGNWQINISSQKSEGIMTISVAQHIGN